MPILGAILTPHPPVLLPEVGRGREREIGATGQAMRAAAREVARWNPDVLIVASPHTVMYRDYFHIAPGEGAAGNMSAFGAPQVRLEVEYDAPLRDEIVRLAQDAGLEAGTLGQRNPALDHGVLLPLTFLRGAGVDCPIIRMGLADFSALDHYRMGRCVAEAVEALGRRAVFVASGDLSHKLKADGPYGFAPEGPVFDTAVTDAMASGDFLQFLTMDPTLCHQAAECGLRSFQMMAGALDGLAVEPRLLSHEGPFGVGYAVALFPVTGQDETVVLLSKLNTKQHIEVELNLDELDLTSAESKATYEEIKAYVLEHTGLKVSHLYIAQVKQKYGIIERENYNKPKSENAKQPKCPPEKEAAITEALKFFGMI